MTIVYKKNRMNRKILVSLMVVVLLCCLLPTSSFSAPAHENVPGIEKLEYERAFFEKKRDPVFSGMLSWYMPGLGQYYCGEVYKGTFFLITEYVLVIGAIFYFMDFDFAAGGGSGFKVGVDAKRTDLGVIETSRKNVFLGILSLAVVIHIFNVSDAYQSAKTFNQKLEKRRMKLRKKYPDIRIGYSRRNLYLGYAKLF